jgi:hypothetical protein
VCQLVQRLDLAGNLLLDLVLAFVRGVTCVRDFVVELAHQLVGLFEELARFVFSVNEVLFDQHVVNAAVQFHEIPVLLVDLVDTIQ